MPESVKRRGSSGPTIGATERSLASWRSLSSTAMPRRLGLGRGETLTGVGVGGDRLLQPLLERRGRLAGHQPVEVGEQRLRALAARDRVVGDVQAELAGAQLRVRLAGLA